MELMSAEPFTMEAWNRLAEKVAKEPSIPSVPNGDIVISWTNDGTFLASDTGKPIKLSVGGVPTIPIGTIVEVNSKLVSAAIMEIHAPTFLACLREYGYTAEVKP